MANRIFLKLGDIKGTSQDDKNHKEWIEIESFSYGVNTVEIWSITKEFAKDVVNHHGFRCQDERRKRDTDRGCSVSEAQIEDPVGTIWVVDTKVLEIYDESFFDYGRPPTGGPAQYARHTGGFNTIHADGHVKFYRSGSTKPSQWTIQDD